MWEIILFVCVLLFVTYPYWGPYLNSLIQGLGESGGSEDSGNPNAPPEQPMLGSRVIGVKASDKQLYVKNKINEPWYQLESLWLGTGGTGTNSGSTAGVGNPQSYLYSFLSAVQMRDGKLLALTVDNKLLFKSNFSDPWTVVATEDVNTIPMKTISQLSTGKIIGIGRNNKMYTKDSLSSPWIFLVDTDCISLQELGDGTLLGLRKINDKCQFQSKSSLTSVWNPLKNNEIPCGIEKPQTGNTIDNVGVDPYSLNWNNGFAVLKNMKFNVHQAIDNEWKNLSGTYIMDGIVTTIGIFPYRSMGSDQKLGEALSPLFSWVELLFRKGYKIIKSIGDKVFNRISVFKEVINAKLYYRLVGIDTDGYLHTSNQFTLDSANLPDFVWTKQPTDNCCYSDVYQLNDLTMVAIKKDDGLLYTRNNWVSPWVKLGVAEPIIKQIAVLSDGKIAGISDNVNNSCSPSANTQTCLFIRKTLTSPWERDTSAINLNFLSLMRDGSQLGVFLDNKVRTRVKTGLQWNEVSNSDGVKAVVQMADGTFIGLSSGLNNGALVTRKSFISDETWKDLPDTTCCWTSIQNLR